LEAFIQPVIRDKILASLERLVYFKFEDEPLAGLEAAQLGPGDASASVSQTFSRP
jgi:hypothetical protein